MVDESSTVGTGAHPLPPMQVYGLAAVCLAAGLGIGYLCNGWVSSRALTAAVPPGSVPPITTTVGHGVMEVTPSSGQPGQPVMSAVPAGHPAMGASRGKMPSLEEMKQIADRQAAPLQEKLKTEPKNSELLVQVGAIYHATHQFKEAARFYGMAVETDPRNVATRTRLASSLYRGGDVDGSIAQLNQALSYDPNDANALFDLGMIRLQGKQDGKGALAAWKRLLKANPQLSSDRRATVEKLMADVLTTLNDQHGAKGDQRP